MPGGEIMGTCVRKHAYSGKHPLLDTRIISGTCPRTHRFTSSMGTSVHAESLLKTHPGER